MALKEYQDHRGLCTWHHDTTDVRCSAPGIMGSARVSVCETHLDAHMKATKDPADYADWRAARDAQLADVS